MSTLLASKDFTLDAAKGGKLLPAWECTLFSFPLPSTSYFWYFQSPPLSTCTLNTHIFLSFLMILLPLLFSARLLNTCPPIHTSASLWPTFGSVTTFPFPLLQWGSNPGSYQSTADASGLLSETVLLSFSKTLPRAVVRSLWWKYSQAPFHSSYLVVVSIPSRHMEKLWVYLRIVSFPELHGSQLQPPSLWDNSQI